jgi:CRISPR/Cas system-associated protein endoribonuclease Cas2
MPSNFLAFIWQDGFALESLKCFSMINKDITEAKEKAEQSLKNFKPDSEVIKATDEYKKLYSELEIKDNELKKLKEDLDKLKEKTKNPFDAFRKKE